VIRRTREKLEEQIHDEYVIQRGFESGRSLKIEISLEEA
jgi:hypothetical protein